MVYYILYVQQVPLGVNVCKVFYVHVCMYVCRHKDSVCMYVCMYVCMSLNQDIKTVYVCMYVYILLLDYTFTNKTLVYVCMYVCSVCMYV